MSVHPRAGLEAAPDELVDIAKLLAAYADLTPDAGVREQRVAFGTSGHRGSAFKTSFNRAHVVAVVQAVCEYRAAQGSSGPLYLGRDTHALSEPAWQDSLEVLAANGVTTMVDARDGYTPTPAISHAILCYNHARSSAWADGIVITPSHNPPADGGIKYNPPQGGPAATDITRWIENRANELLAAQLTGVKRLPLAQALRAATTHRHDYIQHYVADLGAVVDMQRIRAAGLRIGIDPLGGSAVDYWAPIAELYGLDITVVNPRVDGRFDFMPLDWDGKIRMDCSSPYAMAKLIAMKDDYDVACGNDADCDRHGIVTRSVGLMNPNHYLAVAIDYLFGARAGWRGDAGIGKTLVSSSLIDRVAVRLGRRLVEVPVGFKYFVPGLLSGDLGFGGEESAGASFLRRDGGVWCTDKDGVIMDLLAAEIMATRGRDPGECYRELVAALGEPVYARIDAAATAAEKAILGKLSPHALTASTLAGDVITATLTHAPGNGAAIGGLKVVTAQGWFAARPSGTEDVYKLYAESFRGAQHLQRIQEEGQALIKAALASA